MHKLFVTIELFIILVMISSLNSEFAFILMLIVSCLILSILIKWEVQYKNEVFKNGQLKKFAEIANGKMRATFQYLSNSLGDGFKVTLMYCDNERPIAAVFFNPNDNEIELFEEKSDTTELYLNCLRKIRWKDRD